MIHKVVVGDLDTHCWILRERAGHGRDTTIGTERPHLPEWAARGW